MAKLLEGCSLADHASLECFGDAIRVLAGKVGHLVIIRLSHGLELKIEVIRDSSQRRHHNNGQQLVEDGTQGSFLLFLDGVVVVLHVALAGGIHPGRASPEQLRHRCLACPRHVHHEAVVSIRDPAKGVLVGEIIILLAQYLDAVIVHHRVLSLDGIVKAFLRLFRRRGRQHPHAFQFHHPKVGHERQHGDIPAHVVPFPELVNDMLHLGSAPIVLRKFLQIRERPPCESEYPAMMHPDSFCQDVRVDGVCVRKTKLWIVHILHKRLIRGDPAPPIQHQKPLVVTRSDAVKFQRLIQFVLLPGDHDKSAGSAIEPAPFQPRQHPVIGPCPAFSLFNGLDRIRLHL